MDDLVFCGFKVYDGFCVCSGRFEFFVELVGVLCWSEDEVGIVDSDEGVDYGVFLYVFMV